MTKWDTLDVETPGHTVGETDEFLESQRLSLVAIAQFYKIAPSEIWWCWMTSRCRSAAFGIRPVVAPVAITG